MPAISGENSQDPQLLGVDEYVKKGLIPPPEKKAGADSGEAPSTREDAPDGAK
jgi:hypothetical protein